MLRRLALRGRASSTSPIRKLAMMSEEQAPPAPELTPKELAIQAYRKVRSPRTRPDHDPDLPRPDLNPGLKLILSL